LTSASEKFSTKSKHFKETGKFVEIVTDDSMYSNVVLEENQNRTLKSW